MIRKNSSIGQLFGVDVKLLDSNQFEVTNSTSDVFSRSKPDVLVPLRETLRAHRQNASPMNQTDLSSAGSNSQMADVNCTLNNNLPFDDSADLSLDKSSDDASTDTSDEDAEEEQTIQDDVYHSFAKSVLV